MHIGYNAPAVEATSGAYSLIGVLSKVRAAVRTFTAAVCVACLDCIRAPAYFQCG